MYLTFANGTWAEGNVPVMGAMDHGVWLGSSIFDGARAIRGYLPDLRLHLARAIRSADYMGLQCPFNLDELEQLCRDGVQKFPSDAEIYIRPLVFGTEGLLIPSQSGFALSLFDAPLPSFTGFSACLSHQLRPNPSMAPTDAKASCLYPNTTRALRDAKDALLGLGYRDGDVSQALKKAFEDVASPPKAEDLIRSALQVLR